MSQGLFLDLLDRGISDAKIRFNVGGRDIDVGRGANGNGHVPDVVVRVSNPRMFNRSLAQGSLGLAESFMDGDFVVENDNLPLFLEIMLRNRLDKKVMSNPKMALRIGWMRVFDTIKGKADNVQRHYDLGDDLFESFLDKTLTYSCGYALDPNDDLDTLQQNKLERICKKLRIREGDRLLDIGCGFGGLLMHAAKYHGAKATGVTLSRRHCEFGNERVAREGLQDRVKIEYADFNDVKGEFDRVVSVGMLEHVPRREYGKYYGKIADVLTPDGIGLVHVIGANAPKNEHDPFSAKYVFPNANQVKLSEIAHGLEQKGLAILDVENMIRHYHYTAKGWLKNFRANRERLDVKKYDATFKKMWEFYLSACVAAAKASDAALYQVLFMKDYTAAMPLHRV